jgi:uncharacterized oxidoreductase
MILDEMHKEKTMHTQGNTILITGGGSGIGLALARWFVRHNNRVIICGRDEAKLAAARHTMPNLETKRCDVSIQCDRDELVQWTLDHFPGLNIVINNAGILHVIDVASESFDFTAIEQELRTNLYAPIDLTLRFLPHLRQQSSAAIVNISSGLVYSPAAIAPIYATTKAGVHAFTQTIRYQLRDTRLKVFEVFPPTVDTTLNADVQVNKISPHAAAEAIVQGIAKDTQDIRIGQVKALYIATRIAPTFINDKINEVIAQGQQQSRNGNAGKDS